MNYEIEVKEIIRKHLKAIVNETQRLLLTSIDNYEDIYVNAYFKKLYEGVKPLIMIREIFEQEKTGGRITETSD